MSRLIRAAFSFNRLNLINLLIRINLADNEIVLRLG